MDIEKVKKLIDLAKEEGLSQLEYEKKDEKISFSFPYAQVQGAIATQAPVSQVSGQASAASAGNTASPSSEYHEIKSPFVGTFYVSPSPNDPPYVKAGDKVTKGKVLCILEAMKIMNEIESDVNGEVVEVCVENESLVEYGQVLFRVKA